MDSNLQLSYKQYTTNKMKKDYKAQRLYMKLSKADTFLKKIKAEQKISDYFFNKRKQEEKDKQYVNTNKVLRKGK